MAKESGEGALGRGEDRTWSMALLRYFFPMYPLGQSVSEMSSMGMTNGRFEEDKNLDEDNEGIFDDFEVMKLKRVIELIIMYFFYDLCLAFIYKYS